MQYSNDVITNLVHMTGNFELTARIIGHTRPAMHIAVLYYYYTPRQLASNEHEELSLIVHQEGLCPTSKVPTKLVLPCSVKQLHELPVKSLVHEFGINKFHIPHLRRIYANSNS